MGKEQAEVFDRIEAFRRRRPRLRDDVVTLAHGAGGGASAALLEAVFLPAFGNDVLEAQTDAALLTLPSGERVAFSTDATVVTPLRFPHASLGHLAVHGTINDLAMVGAQPLGLSAAFVVEEGFAVAELRDLVADMAEAAAAAGVTVVAGDTRVVDRGAADGVYVVTSGMGLVPPGRTIDAAAVRPGDVVLLSGTLGDHGMAVLLARGLLPPGLDIVSDTAPLHDLVETLLAAAPGTRWLRDVTRGGLAAVGNQLARDAEVAVVLDGSRLPVRPQVAAACAAQGVDPLQVANEGKLVAVVPPDQAGRALAALHGHPLGREAVRVGEVRSDPPGEVVVTSPTGPDRALDLLAGAPLPRIS